MDLDSNIAKYPHEFDGIKSIIKYQTINRVLDSNKAKYPQRFDIILELDMSQTCFRVWDMTQS